jgi:hypothetical protein
MARRKDNAPSEADTISRANEDAPLTEHGDDTLPPLDEGEHESTNRAADPRPWMTVNLSGYNGGPSAHLLRSYQYKQLQIRFDHEQPDEQYQTMLRRAGWKDRTESEGVWTKQIDPDARWQSVAQMEQEFKAVANAIRRDKGMEPVLETRARG